MGIIWSSGLLLFLFADWLHIPYYVGPVSTWVVWLILFSIPVPLLYWRSRLWLFKEIVSGCGQWVAFGATLKIHKNPILIGISSNFLHNIKNPKFVKNWPKYRDFGQFSSKMKRREFSTFIIFSDTYTCTYVG